MRAVGEAHGLHKLTANQVREIFALAQSGCMSQRQIAKQFDISQSCVANIKNGHRWSWLLEKEEEGA